MNITLTKNQIRNSYSALSRLPTPIKAPRAIAAFTKNLILLEAENKTIEESRQKLFKQHFGEDVKQVKETDPRFQAYDSAFSDMLGAQTQVNADTLTKADLNLEENAFPPILLKEIVWFVTDF